MAFLAGCYYHVQSTDYYASLVKHYLPRVESSTHTRILSTTSRTQLIQNFVNRGETALPECIYTFPLYDGVSVVSFTCRVGEKVLHGLVKERAKAKAIYEQAVARGETAGLMDQAPEASDVFSTKLGNIPAGATVVVEIEYIGELKHDAEYDGIRFTVPVSVAPRYGSAPQTMVADGSRPVYDGGMRITVDASMAEGSFIQAISSPSHPIAVTLGTVSNAPNDAPTMSKASATLTLQHATLDTDFVLIVQNKDSGTPRAYLESHPTIAHQRALMVSLVPKFTLPSIRPEIVFVADRSGSMDGKIATLVSAMRVFLKSMPTGVSFNICSFGSSESFLWPKSKRYTPESLAQADQHLNTFAADFGGTETMGAVRATIERRLTDLPLEVILLTDGDIWQQEVFFTYVRDQVRQSDASIRLFPLGIGSGVSSALIEGAARAGNGFAQMVHDGERLDNRVVRMLKGALTPHVADYKLEVKFGKHDTNDGHDDDDYEMIDEVTKGVEIVDIEKLAEQETATADKAEPISLFDPTADPDKMDDGPEDRLAKLNIPIPKILQAPHDIPALFPFSRTSVYLLLSPETQQTTPTSVILRGKSPNGPLELEIPIEVLGEPAATIHQLAARKAAQDLEEGRHWIIDATANKEELLRKRFPSLADDLVAREAVRLGTQFQVMNRWCSFVAVADNDDEASEKKSSSPAAPAPLQSPGESSRAGGQSIGFRQKSMVRKRVHALALSAPPPPPPSGPPGALYFFDNGFGGDSALPDMSTSVAKQISPSSSVSSAAAVSRGSPSGTFGALSKPAGALRGLFGGGGSPRSSKMKMAASPVACCSPAPGATNEAAPPSPTQTVPDHVHALIALQTFDGWWEADAALARLLSVSEPELEAKEAGGVKTVACRVWVSLLVLAWLAQKAATEEEVWELVAEKARMWLDGVKADGFKGDVAGWEAEAKALMLAR